MRKRLLLSILLSTPLPAYAQSAVPVQACDRQAAGPRAGLGKAYAIVDGVAGDKINIGAAMDACRQAIATYPNEPRFHHQLGRVLANSKDYAGARKEYELAAKMNYAPADYNIFGMISDGLGYQKDEKLAETYLRAGAQGGNADSQAYLAQIYYLGSDNTKQDVAQAAKWYRAAAEQGHVQAMVQYGNMLHDGEGVPKDLKAGNDWYRRAADTGSIDGEVAIGLIYELGQGVDEDFTESAKWYKAAASQGDPESMFLLGRLYERGEVISKSEGVTLRATHHDEAAQWYLAGAKAGEPRAQRKIGLAYLNGDGVPKNRAEGVKWLKASAKQDDADAIKYIKDNGIK